MAKAFVVLHCPMHILMSNLVVSRKSNFPSKIYTGHLLLVHTSNLSVTAINILKQAIDGPTKELMTTHGITQGGHELV